MAKGQLARACAWRQGATPASQPSTLGRGLGLQKPHSRRPRAPVAVCPQHCVGKEKKEGFFPFLKKESAAQNNARNGSWKICFHREETGGGARCAVQTLRPLGDRQQRRDQPGCVFQRAEDAPATRPPPEPGLPSTPRAAPEPCHRPGPAAGRGPITLGDAWDLCHTHYTHTHPAKKPRSQCIAFILCRHSSLSGALL